MMLGICVYDFAISRFTNMLYIFLYFSDDGFARPPVPNFDLK